MQMSNEAKNAILNIFAHAAWTVGNGQQYYDALADAFFGVVSISAVYTQGGTVYDTDTLDSLKADLVVTATLKDSTTQTVPSTDYILSGTLTAGTRTITVSYGGHTATFTVNVTAYWDFEWDCSEGVIPSGMTYKTYNFTDETGILFVQEPNLDFDHIGDCELEVEMKCYNDKNDTAYNAPSLSVLNGAKAGFKIYGSTPTYYMTNISGSNANTSVSCFSYHTLYLKNDNGSYTLSIDGTAQTGSGVTNNNYLNHTGIACASNQYHVIGAFIKSIKFRGTV